MRPPGPVDLRAPDGAEGFVEGKLEGKDASWPASGIPVIPALSESPGASRLVIGFASDSDVLLSGKPPYPGANPVCVTIYHTPQGWIAVNGALNPDGTVIPSATGLFVNGQRVQVYTALAANDALQIPDATGSPYSGDSFIFVDPLAAPPAVPGEENLEIGDAWIHRMESDGNISAFASFRALIDKYNENQDRMAVASASDGGVMMVAIDGMGGHDSGERSAEIGRRAFYDAVDSGCGLGDSIEAMNTDMYADNQSRRAHGGAVVAGVHLHVDGRIEVRTVGDSEVLVMSLTADGFGDLRLDYWSTRPSYGQEDSYHVPTLPDGRVVLGRERTLRLDPESNIVNKALGLYKGPLGRRQTVDWVDTEPGRIYFAIPMSDGLSEQYINHEEMTAVVRDTVRRTGDVSPDGIRDAFLRDSLIRCSLARRAYRESRPFEITQPVFRETYREMTLEMDGVASDPPDDLPVWRYQSRTGADGRQERYFMIPSGGTAYVVRGVSVPGQGVIPDPAVVNPAAGRMISNPAKHDHPSVVGRFKQDNISIGVLAFVPEPRFRP